MIDLLNNEGECKCCKLLQEQLDYERDRNREMLETLTSLLKPQVIIQPESEFKPITPHFTRWSRRRAELERLEREKIQINKTSPVVANPDSEEINKLEEELGVQNEQGVS